MISTKTIKAAACAALVAAAFLTIMAKQSSALAPMTADAPAVQAIAAAAIGANS